MTAQQLWELMKTVSHKHAPEGWRPDTRDFCDLDPWKQTVLEEMTTAIALLVRKGRRVVNSGLTRSKAAR